MATTWLNDRITTDPERCGGRPTVRATRLRVVDVLDMLASGMSELEILREFPELESEDVRAALAFAANEMDHMVLKAG
jgi:uncharacterized protein (DUF433 family)